MAKSKPVCPSCGQKSFIIRQTFAIKSNLHPLEYKRYAYYKCSNCNAEYLLTTPEGKLEAITNGKITHELAERVLLALKLPVEYADKLK